ncbi:MAG TPA: SDR family NAD(P)-dependent oxidoreductase [Actinomycetota bacterium]
MPDLSQQTILVTGATDGLGRALAAELARRGATVLAHGRSRERLDETVAELEAASGGDGRVRGYLADLASLEEVAGLAAQVAKAEPRLDVLVSNAGIGSNVPGGEQRLESRDGIELRFAVNYLAGYVLTRQLLPLLQDSVDPSGGPAAAMESARASSGRGTVPPEPPRPARIVNVSSIGQAPIDFDDVQLTRAYSGYRAYCQSKLAQILDTITLAEQLDGSGVTVNALHPATFMATKIVASPISEVAEGVEATLRLATGPALDGVSGRFFDGQREARANQQAYDPAARQRLAEVSEQLTGISAKL